jgi:hypothetical protein
VSVPEDHERAFSGDNAESEAPVAAKKCVMAAVRHARRQMLCRPGDKVVAMYNVERRCAVIRVIEVTDDVLDETTGAEALVGEPAGVDPAGRAGGVGEHEAFSCLCLWGNAKRSKLYHHHRRRCFFHEVAVATKTLTRHPWVSDTATRRRLFPLAKSLFRAV